MKNLESSVSYHCCGRIDERAGLKGDTALRFAKNAIRSGKSAMDFNSGAERKHLSEKSRDDIKAIAYNGFCFIVDETENRVITMYLLPEWFGKHKVFDGKIKVNNAKKYMRMNGNSFVEAMAF